MSTAQYLKANIYILRYRSRADFDKDDFRLTMPRFSEENFHKNVELADKLKVIADKYNATPSQITLAWILAEDKNCMSFVKSLLLSV